MTIFQIAITLFLVFLFIFFLVIGLKNSKKIAEEEFTADRKMLESLDDERIFDPDSGVYLTIEEIESGSFIKPDKTEIYFRSLPDYIQDDLYLATEVKLNELGYEKINDFQKIFDILSESQMNFGFENHSEIGIVDSFEKDSTIFLIIQSEYEYSDGTSLLSTNEWQLTVLTTKSNLSSHFTGNLNAILNKTPIQKMPIGAWTRSAVFERNKRFLLIRQLNSLQPEDIPEMVSVCHQLP